MDNEQIVSESNFNLHKPLNTLSDGENSKVMQFNSRQGKDEGQTELMYCYENGQGGNISNTSSRTSPKKRKLDKDGFVTPATPDIPKSSCQFGQSDISEGLSDNVAGMMYTGSPRKNLRKREKMRKEEKRSVIQRSNKDHSMVGAKIPLGSLVHFFIGNYNKINGLKKFEQLVSSLQTENPNSVVTVPPEQSDQSLTPAGDLIRELGEENKNVFMQFSKLFKEREEYEMMCPEKLDKLLEQARTLEENLIQQKGILCKRLKGLSQTLKLL